jgi:hypothetical protein
MKKMLRFVIPLLLLTACYDPGLMPGAHEQPVTTTYRIAWPWDASIVYSKGDPVTRPENLPGGPVYTSQQDENIGQCPPSLIVGSDPPRQVWGATQATPGWEAWWRQTGVQQ